jgi:hypothetical protein
MKLHTIAIIPACLGTSHLPGKELLETYRVIGHKDTHQGAQ